MNKKWVALMTASALVASSVSVVSAKGTPEGDVSLPQIVDKDKNKLFDTLDEKLDKVKDEDLVDVIVMYKDQAASIDKHMEKAQSEIGQFKTKAKYSAVFNGFAASLSKKQIKQLQKDDAIKQIELDMPVQAFMGTAQDSFGSKKAATDFGLDGDRDGNPTSYSKNDVVVAVIDTGVDAAHVDLDGGKVIAFKDWVGNKTVAYDDNGHGTHVSGIIAGTGEANASYKGVAPGAAIVGLKVLDSAGSGTMSNVAAAVDWAVANKDTYGIKVINMSLGTSGSSDGTDATSVAVNNANAAGIAVMVAAGNSGPNRSTIGSPGAASGAITVGAMADVGELGFNLRDFSSRGPTADGRIKPDIASPGYNIMAAKANSGNGYVSYSGTSMATPFTAGVAALMLDANYSLTPTDIRSKLTTTAQDWGPAGQDIDFGFGRLQAYEAIKSAGGFTGTGPAVPDHTYVSGSIAAKGERKQFTVNVTDINTPLSASLVMSVASSTRPDFDLYVYDPTGVRVGASETTKRQDQVSFKPTKTGAYTVEVYSYSGTGPFFLDVSYK
ncbi:S8 family serine peptidase [Brevibacillus dissolubilis]|uniref:S8 family serine peptidase n=1 Tax=Brevibacillus dissolubilis TaxID=1844116 RepID=UPI0011179431|nr:S8 family serine peptidase [Brevibacillus dissolubilis]